MLTIPSTLLILLAGPYLAISRGDYPFYLPTADLRAVDWLAEQVGETDIVLASYAMGNTIPTRAPCRVFVGHQFGSYRVAEKLALVERFYHEETAEETRQGILEEYGVTWVYYGSIERKLGELSPVVANLRTAYDRDGVTIYRVQQE
jgi:uncharacterized membrane protein